VCSLWYVLDRHINALAQFITTQSRHLQCMSASQSYCLPELLAICSQSGLHGGGVTSQSGLHGGVVTSQTAGLHGGGVTSQTESEPPRMRAKDARQTAQSRPIPTLGGVRGSLSCIDVPGGCVKRIYINNNSYLHERDSNVRSASRVCLYHMSARQEVT